MTGGKRPGAGRKARKIDLADLERLCTLNCTDQEIAAFLNISVRTLARRRTTCVVSETMERGKAKGRLSVRRILFRLAENGNVAAAIFLAKNLLGYRDVVNTQHSGLDGAPIELATSPDLSQLSDEELRQLRTITQKTQSPSRD